MAICERCNIEEMECDCPQWSPEARDAIERKTMERDTDILLNSIECFTRPNALVAVDIHTTGKLVGLLRLAAGKILDLQDDRDGWKRRFDLQKEQIAALLPPRDKSPVHVGEPIEFEGFRLRSYSATPAPNRPVRQ